MREKDIFSHSIPRQTRGSHFLNLTQQMNSLRSLLGIVLMRQTTYKIFRRFRYHADTWALLSVECRMRTENFIVRHYPICEMKQQRRGFQISRNHVNSAMWNECWWCTRRGKQKMPTSGKWYWRKWVWSCIYYSIECIEGVY